MSKTNNTNNRLLTIAMVQNELSCSRTFVYKLLFGGLLKSVKIGSSRRILENSLVALKENGYEGDIPQIYEKL
tara:strand:+ start:4084 stop:4302 length:219 start_codon:yes stop_codon:yes gene_type:complete